MSVALIGYRGSGKTTIGRRLADRLWEEFEDIDDLIVKTAGKSIKDIFAQDGEPHFRDLETQALRKILAEGPAVIGLGGGTVMRQENRELLKQSGRKVVYLRCEPEVLLKRVEADPRSAETRPNLTNLGGGIEEIKLKLTEREPVYRQVMTSELDVTNLSPDEAVVRIARMI